MKIYNLVICHLLYIDNSSPIPEFDCVINIQAETLEEAKDKAEVFLKQRDYFPKDKAIPFTDLSWVSGEIGLYVENIGKSFKLCLNEIIE